MTTTFKPSKDLIRAAELLFLAMAAEQLVREPVRAYQAKVLEATPFVVAPGMPGAGERILDPDKTWLMPFEDMERFVELCEVERKRANIRVMKVGNCPSLEAQHTKVKAETHLIEVAAAELPVRGLEKALTASLELREQTVTLVLKLLAPFVREAPGIIGSLR